MKMYPSCNRHASVNLAAPILFIAVTLAIIFLLPAPAVWAQYEIKNDRILAPEVTHFTRIAEPGVDAHGDLSLSIPLMTVPGRDGLNFEIVANYRSGIQVTQSASWIGLGWELDVGSITRHPLGAINQQPQTDWARAVDFSPIGDITSQPDAYSVNMNGSSTILLSTTIETNPALPLDPDASSELGPCFLGQGSALWYFVPSPWKPWKFCYGTAEPVTVDGQMTSHASTNRQDFSKFTITSEEGRRYVFDRPTLAEAFFPPEGTEQNNY